jgi:DNA-binding protein H-NS
LFDPPPVQVPNVGFAEEANSGQIAIGSFISETTMRKLDLADMDFDELWLVHEELTKILAEKIGAEKRKLEKRLAQLNRREQIGEATAPSEKSDRPRRKYPKVLPKYFNPSAPLETWSGRGKQPLWFAAALRSGHGLEDLRIPVLKEATGHRVRRGQRA